MTSTRCPACGALPPEGARFCPACGRPLGGGGTAERKLATVVFADLAGSTELATSMDAEMLRGLLADVYDQLWHAAEAYGGTVEKFIGDAVMAVFGVPVAHEDDPERAVRAALVMRSRLGGVGERRDMRIALRIGINTGLVVTGVTPGRDFLVTGEAVNLAARLQQAAEPGEILVGERTFRAVEPLARTVAPRSLRVKGRSGPVTAYAVERMAPAGSYRRRRRPFGPFVGREPELTLLRSLVERAVEHSRPHLITIVGEPGIGKSRLLEEAVVELRRSDEPPAVWVGRCLPYGEAGPYAPLRDVLVRAAAVRADDPPQEAIARVTGFLHALVPGATGEWIDGLLRTVSNRRRRLRRDGDEVRRDPQAVRDAWRTLLQAMAAREPTLLVIEDAHWAEPALLELIASVVRTEARVPLVVLCLARDELLVQHPGWGSGMRDETTVTLSALGADQMRRLATALGGEHDSGVALAGGNPFFLEEILAMTGEGGERVPETVQGVIAARLDLLAPELKQVLQQASVIGRRFTHEQLAALSGERDLGRTLRRLAERGLVVAEPGGGRTFKHALIRDVAYESIPRSERARLHLTLARSLEGDPVVSRQTLATHFAAAAGLGAQDARADAVRLLLAAASDARSVYAHGLARRQATLAQSLAADEREHALAAEAVGDACWMTEAADEAWSAYRQALGHAERAGLGPGDLARLRWKWVDMPTRWGSMLTERPLRRSIDEMVSQGLAEARAAGAAAVEGRLLVASALTRWRYDSADRASQEVALRAADDALAVGERLERPALRSAAMDARIALLLSLGRYADARAEADERLDLVLETGGHEERMDACSQAIRTRAAVGDFAAAVAAGDLVSGAGERRDEHWRTWPTLQLAEALFYWDRWERALEAYERFLELYRRTGGRRAGKAPARASGVAAAVHLLRGDQARAEELEQRVGAGAMTDFHLMVGHALLGRGEPDLALDRLRHVDRGRPLALAVGAEALAMLGRWDDLDEALARAMASPGVEQMPRVIAQLDRARGIAGEEAALERAAAEFGRLGCRFERARCLEIGGDRAGARHAYERLGAMPALARIGV
jgi:class 3 adenylate cyclase